MRISVAVLSLGICLAVASCGKSDNGKTVTYSNSNGTVTATQGGDQEHVVVHSANGTATLDANPNGNVHASMPDFAPLYPGAKVTSSLAGANNNGTTGAMVTFTVAASPSDVIGFYKQKASTAGLPQTASADVNNTLMFVAGKDKKSISVTASSSNDVTQVEVIWGSN
jgi:hypothetical protein